MKQPYASDSSVAVSDEKSAGARGSEGAIDLAIVEARAVYEIKNGRPSEFAEDVLALVRAVRAARAYIGSGHVADRLALDAALAPFTDSAEVRSDGE